MGNICFKKSDPVFGVLSEQPTYKCKSCHKVDTCSLFLEKRNVLEFLKEKEKLYSNQKDTGFSGYEVLECLSDIEIFNVMTIHFSHCIHDKEMALKIRKTHLLCINMAYPKTKSQLVSHLSILKSPEKRYSLAPEKKIVVKQHKEIPVQIEDERDAIPLIDLPDTPSGQIQTVHEHKNKGGGDDNGSCGGQRILASEF